MSQCNVPSPLIPVRHFIRPARNSQNELDANPDTVAPSLCAHERL